MEVTFRAAIDYSLPAVATLLDRGFEGYIVKIPFSAPLVHNMIRVESADLGASVVALVDGEPGAIALIGRRGRESRLGAMAVAVEHRGKGIGKALVERVLEDAQLRKDVAMQLECIQSNEPALKLYESTGFERTRSLIGFVREPMPLEPGEQLQEIELQEVAAHLQHRAPADLPWQVAWPTLSVSSSPSRAFRLGEAVGAITDPSQAAIAIRAIVAGQDRKGQGSRLVKALLAAWPEKNWRVAPMWPEEIAPGFWESVGFSRDSLSQYQMKRHL